MPFIPTTPEEIIPAQPAATASTYKIRRLSLEMGLAVASISPVFEIVIMKGNVSGGLFTPISEEAVHITELAQIGTLMATTPLPGESLSQTTERAAFDYLITNGYVPAGSIEV